MYIADLCKHLQYFAYDPAHLPKELPGWMPSYVFDDRLPAIYPKSFEQSPLFIKNDEGFGGFFAQNKSKNEFAILIKGAEVSEFRFNDIWNANSLGIDQVVEVAPTIYNLLQTKGFFAEIKKPGGMLYIVGHSQGDSESQLLGTYIAARLINEKKFTLAEAVRKIIIRGYAGVGSKKFLKRFIGPDGKKLVIPMGLVENINSVSYLLQDDPAQLYGEAYIGTVYFIDDPKDGNVEEWWAANPMLRSHPRSRYRIADYTTAIESPDHAAGKVGIP